MEMISSKDNIRVKTAKKLYKKKYRTTSYLIEGVHLYEEACKAGAEFVQIFVTEKFANIENARLVSSEVMKFLSDTETPQGIIAEIKLPTLEMTSETLQRLLILENVQDPGNVGTMIRTADAAGFDGVILTAGSADIYSPKVLRTMQGSHFHLPIFLENDIQALYARLKTQKTTVIATTLSAESIDYRTIAKPEKLALVMGNEGSGISAETAKSADILAHINMIGQAESLNVAVAAGIMIFSLTD
ncbi:23S rRNA methyltransferase [Lactococcus hodotermopsidis]|uniref:23S rRNA methyltransferase n=1 Tax=Pseudolactococcus hodotermopsidis TaxID=2709157 RepID=A0A6A0BA26_9LACT|nr:RNA methyltransferase [Lactococcus hodotermopsidis]GFH41646.1 23S rRNA methyltransferase [Lactococcus hodotermopsidis]